MSNGIGEAVGRESPSPGYGSGAPGAAAETVAAPEAERRSDWSRRYLLIAVVGDCLCGLVAGVVALVFSGAVPLDAPLPAPYLAILFGSPIVWMLMVALCHGNDRTTLGAGPEEYRAIPRAGVRLLALTAFISYATYSERPYLSRYFVLIYFPTVVSATLIARYCLRRGLYRARWRGKAITRAVVVGRSDAVHDMVMDLRREPVHGIFPVAVCAGDMGQPACDLPVVGSAVDVLGAVERYRAEVVVVASPSGMTSRELRRLSWDLDDRAIELIVAPGLIEVTGPRLSIRPAANLSLLHVERPALRGTTAAAKMAVDRIVAALACIVLAPVFAVIALLIKLDSRGPVLFRQQRIGLGGGTFRIVKFRSMVDGAEAMLENVRNDHDDGNGVLFKHRDDPRVTRIGRLLRRYSLDELPQLVNVVRGEMSLVGPRPPLPEEVSEYRADAVRRLRVRPGLTGLWQVSGRSDLSWDESLRLDLRYVDNWSVALDVVILWRTLRAVAKGRGAY